MLTIEVVYADKPRVVWARPCDATGAAYDLRNIIRSFERSRITYEAIGIWSWENGDWSRIVEVDKHGKEVRD